MFAQLWRVLPKSPCDLSDLHYTTLGGLLRSNYPGAGLYCETCRSWISASLPGLSAIHTFLNMLDRPKKAWQSLAISRNESAGTNPTPWHRKRGTGRTSTKALGPFSRPVELIIKAPYVSIEHSYLPITWTRPSLRSLQHNYRA